MIHLDVYKKNSAVGDIYGILYRAPMVWIPTMGALRTPSLLPGCVKTFSVADYLQHVSSIAVHSFGNGL